MKKKYLVIAGIVTMLQAALWGCGATPLAGEGGIIPGGAAPGSTEQQAQGDERMQAADSNPEEAADEGKSEETGQETDLDETADGSLNNAEEQSQMQPRRMVMLDGKLYVETSETNSMLRCGVMDGEITSATDGAMPTEDGQSNFGKDIGYQYGMRENRIEIFLDDAWRIFAYNENNLEGVTMEVSDVTKKGATVTFRNSRDQELMFGDDFSLEMLDTETNEWTCVSIVVDGKWGFNSVGYPVDAQQTRDWEVDWSWLYGELAPGQYRIVKGVLDETIGVGMQTVGSGNYVEHTLTCEFMVDEM